MLKFFYIFFCLITCTSFAQSIEFGPGQREVAINTEIELRVANPNENSTYQWNIDGIGELVGNTISVSWPVSGIFVIQLTEITSSAETFVQHDFVNVLPVSPQEKTFDQAWFLLRERIIQTSLLTIDQQPSPFESFPVRNLAFEEGIFSPNWLHENFWTGGFWVGSLWHMYDHSDEETDLERALAWSQGILGDETRNDHDRGFVYFYSSAFAYDRTGEAIYLDSVETAVAKMVELYETAVFDMIPILPNNGQVIIDTMMNLQLFWWHKDRIGDRPDWYAVAEEHADKTLELFFREDGSVWQDVNFGRITGNLNNKGSRQGFDNSEASTWSRGQAWAMFGFTEAWLATDKAEYLTAAEEASNFFINNLPPDHVPWFDFNPAIFDNPNAHLKDSSAAAIAADALLNLAEAHPDEQKTQYYFEQANLILKSLVNNYMGPFSEEDNTSVDGQLIHGCWFWQNDGRRDSELIWGSYYLIDALHRILNQPTINAISLKSPANDAQVIIDANVFTNRLEFANITADLSQLGSGTQVLPDEFDPTTGNAVWKLQTVPSDIQEATIAITLTDGFGREVDTNIVYQKPTFINGWFNYQ